MKKITTFLVCLFAMAFANAQLSSVALVGSGTPQGWPNDPQTDTHVMSSTDGEHWTLNNLALVNGAVKFRGNNSWALPYNWGGTAFPSGTAIIDGNGFTSTPGVYNVAFNSTTGDYSFVLQQNVFTVVGIIGTATPGGWDADTDMTTTDGIHYILNRVPLLLGALKFRQDHTWTATTNWGGDAFPSGTGTLDGAAITVPSDGKYNITFNRTTAEYTFSFPGVAVVGPAAGGWPNDPQVDANQLSTVDGINYTKGSITLLADNAKFRANNSWAVNWGATAFPSGTAILDSPDSFVCTAGDYSVAFNYDSGAYSFGAPLTASSFEKNKFAAFPNPTQNQWNIRTSNGVIENIKVVDVTGKKVISINPNATEAAIDASALQSGIYFAKVSAGNTTSTVKLIKE
ncbi:hypothetical protein FNO01nite_25450 [Flavobacterium noncentrifugens]|uniref:Por secretion system C-terminal sorting domain-containing protein n=1 Tax=Flavobacterium noncentrifugens TaxID=1128970 RepID=A0A1G8ZQC4_9FLAO|nr:T9SS type A sorting domain-containing protein [Flavobacterium noncentrifugens]GEP51873.1 hypothetical protein FNO01nite_25450 [Flavobacterium noncentrifugens]SDK17251.1 Por secretion system C-terminal sorting domain-containing protein [Flavobacterium noncentrifugens]